MSQYIRIVDGGAARRRCRFKGLPWLLCPLLILTSPLILSAVTKQTITITAVTNSADFQPGLPQKGSLASIFTTGLETSPGGNNPAVYTNTQDPLSNVLNGIGVWINFLPAPILSVTFLNGYQQINVQVPWEGERQPLYVEVFQGAARAHSENTQAAGLEKFPPMYELAFTANELSVFFLGANGYGILQHASDFSLVTPQNPAHRGEYLIAYGINLGPVSNQPASGTPAPSNPLARAIASANQGICGISDVVNIGSAKTIPLFVGLAPQTVGVYQINFQVPTFATAGDVPLTLVRSISLAPFDETYPACERATTVTKTSRSVLLPIR